MHILVPRAGGFSSNVALDLGGEFLNFWSDPVPSMAACVRRNGIYRVHGVRATNFVSDSSVADVL